MPWIRGRAVWMPEGRFRSVAVEVRGDRLVGVAERIPAGSSVVDLPDLYLLPGLIDAHVHLCAGLRNGTPPDAIRTESAERAQVMLQAGVTTVRDVGAPAGFLAVRESWNEMPGLAPWTLAAGPPITVPGGHGSAYGQCVRGLGDILAAVEELGMAGVDLIKVMATAGGSEGGQPAFSEEQLRALVGAAHSRGLKVAAHAHSGEGIRRSALAGVDSIEHASFKEGDEYCFDEAVARLLAARRVPVVLTPVQYTKAERSGRAERVQQIEGYWKRLHELGVPIAVGTDVGVPGIDYATATGYALEVLRRAGIPARAVLEAAGPVTATVLGLGQEIGSVETGKRADLIAVPRDPTSDITALSAVEWVMSRGLVVRGPHQTSEWR